MTYQKAIEGAKKCAKMNDINYIVFEFPKKHWWNKKDYCFADTHAFGKAILIVSLVKLLTITPTGTIAQ